MHARTWQLDYACADVHVTNLNAAGVSQKPLMQHWNVHRLRIFLLACCLQAQWPALVPGWHYGHMAGCTLPLAFAARRGGKSTQYIGVLMRLTARSQHHLYVSALY